MEIKDIQEKEDKELIQAVKITQEYIIKNNIKNSKNLSIISICIWLG